jgi:hypothetical protein
LSLPKQKFKSVNYLPFRYVLSWLHVHGTGNSTFNSYLNWWW